MRGAFDGARDSDMPHLRVGEYLVDAIDRAAWHTGAVENIDPLRRWPSPRDRLDRRVELIAVAQARLSARVRRIDGKLLGPERLAQASEQFVAGAGNIDVPVGRREYAGGNRRRMVVAGLLRDLSRKQPARGLEVQHRDLRGEQRSLYPLPRAGFLPLQQRQQNAHRA